MSSRWTSWSLRRRVLMGSGAVLALAALCAVLVFALALDRILYATARNAAIAQERQVAAVIATGQEDAEVAVVETPSQGSLIQLLAGDRVIAASDKGAQLPLTDRRPATGQRQVEQVPLLPGTAHGPYAVVAEGILGRNGEPLTLVVATSLDVAATTVKVATGLLAASAVVLFALLVVLIGRILSSALAPVQRIAEDVARINRVRSGDRITVPVSDDEIARLATTMNLMLDRLDAAEAGRRQFISDASHELRSPLATIRAAIEVGAEGGTEVIRAEVLRLQRLVDDLLTLAKADDAGLVLNVGEVDLDDLVDAEVRRMRAATTTHRIEVRAEPVRIDGDVARLGQAVRNVVDNADRHAVGAVRLQLHVEGDRAVLQVDNDGPVIPAPTREAIFERFTRLQPSRERDSGGSGLGLAITRTLVERHGGTVHADQAPDGWCRFEIRLPLTGRGADQTEVSSSR